MYPFAHLELLAAIPTCAACLMVLMGLDKRLLVRRVEKRCPACGARRRDCRCRQV